MDDSREHAVDDGNDLSSNSSLYDGAATEHASDHSLPQVNEENDSENITSVMVKNELFRNNSGFYCSICNYTTIRRNDLGKHFTTAKHILKCEEVNGAMSNTDGKTLSTFSHHNLEDDSDPNYKRSENFTSSSNKNDNKTTRITLHLNSRKEVNPKQNSPLEIDNEADNIEVEDDRFREYYDFDDISKDNAEDYTNDDDDDSSYDYIDDENEDDYELEKNLKYRNKVKERITSRGSNQQSRNSYYENVDTASVVHDDYEYDDDYVDDEDFDLESESDIIDDDDDGDDNINDFSDDAAKDYSNDDSYDEYAQRTLTVNDDRGNDSQYQDKFNIKVENLPGNSYHSMKMRNCLIKSHVSLNNLKSLLIKEGELSSSGSFAGHVGVSSEPIDRDTFLHRISKAKDHLSKFSTNFSRLSSPGLISRELESLHMCLKFAYENGKIDSNIPTDIVKYLSSNRDLNGNKISNSREISNSNSNDSVNCRISSNSNNRISNNYKSDIANNADNFNNIGSDIGNNNHITKNPGIAHEIKANTHIITKSSDSSFLFSSTNTTKPIDQSIVNIDKDSKSFNENLRDTSKSNYISPDVNLNGWLDNMKSYWRNIRKRRRESQTRNLMIDGMVNSSEINSYYNNNSGNYNYENRPGGVFNGGLERSDKHVDEVSYRILLPEDSKLNISGFLQINKRLMNLYPKNNLSMNVGGVSDTNMWPLLSGIPCYCYENVPFTGWKKEVTVRMNGKSKGQMEVQYKAPYELKKIKNKADLSAYFTKHGFDPARAADFDFRSVFCVCHRPDNKKEEYLECSFGYAGCGSWVHPGCIGLGYLHQSQLSNLESIICPLCCTYLEGAQEKQFETFLKRKRLLRNITIPSQNPIKVTNIQSINSQKSFGIVESSTAHKVWGIANNPSLAHESYIKTDGGNEMNNIRNLDSNINSDNVRHMERSDSYIARNSSSSSSSSKSYAISRSPVASAVEADVKQMHYPLGRVDSSDSYTSGSSTSQFYLVNNSRYVPRIGKIDSNISNDIVSHCDVNKIEKSSVIQTPFNVSQEPTTSAFDEEEAVFMDASNSSFNSISHSILSLNSNFHLNSNLKSTSVLIPPGLNPKMSHISKPTRINHVLFQFRESVHSTTVEQDTSSDVSAYLQALFDGVSNEEDISEEQHQISEHGSLLEDNSYRVDIADDYNRNELKRRSDKNYRIENKQILSGNRRRSATFEDGSSLRVGFVGGWIEHGFNADKNSNNSNNSINDPDNSNRYNELSSTREKVQYRIETLQPNKPLAAKLKRKLCDLAIDNLNNSAQTKKLISKSIASASKSKSEFEFSNVFVEQPLLVALPLDDGGLRISSLSTSAVTKSLTSLCGRSDVCSCCFETIEAADSKDSQFSPSSTPQTQKVKAKRRKTVANFEERSLGCIDVNLHKSCAYMVDNSNLIFPSVLSQSNNRIKLKNLHYYEEIDDAECSICARAGGVLFHFEIDPLCSSSNASLGGWIGHVPCLQACIISNAFKLDSNWRKEDNDTSCNPVLENSSNESVGNYNGQDDKDEPSLNDSEIKSCLDSIITKLDVNNDSLVAGNTLYSSSLNISKPSGSSNTPLSRFDHLLNQHQCSLCGDHRGVTLRCMASSCSARAHPICIPLLQYCRQLHERPWGLYTIAPNQNLEDSFEGSKSTKSSDLSPSPHLICLCSLHSTSNADEKSDALEVRDDSELDHIEPKYEAGTPFRCNICNYVTERRGDYEKHLRTSRHSER